jgi:TonB-dependent SusC/RagA subfamily outer membrane receptor
LLTGLLAGILLASFAAPLKAQQTGTVRGVVFEAGSSRPLTSAEVQVFRIDGAAPAALIGAITDRGGAFVLQDVPPGSAEVRADHLGHSARTITVQVTPGGTADAAFELPPTVFDLDEIVVTGTAGAFQKKQLGNTIATVDAAELETAPITTLSELIQAREPSVVGLTSDGATGSGTRLRIRGSNSLSMSNEPVVYVDGMRVDNSGNMGYNGRFGATTSRLDDINWEAVERVEILKGAAAATLYGSEASSGVIQVFTKQGSPNRSRITLRFEGGTSTYPDGAVKPNAGFARDALRLHLWRRYGRHRPGPVLSGGSLLHRGRTPRGAGPGGQHDRRDAPGARQHLAHPVPPREALVPGDRELHRRGARHVRSEQQHGWADLGDHDGQAGVGPVLRIEHRQHTNLRSVHARLHRRRQPLGLQRVLPYAS